MALGGLGRGINFSQTPWVGQQPWGVTAEPWRQQMFANVAQNFGRMYGPPQYGRQGMQAGSPPPIPIQASSNPLRQIFGLG